MVGSGGRQSDGGDTVTNRRGMFQFGRVAAHSEEEVHEGMEREGTKTLGREENQVSGTIKPGSDVN